MTVRHLRLFAWDWRDEDISVLEVVVHSSVDAEGYARFDVDWQAPDGAWSLRMEGRSGVLVPPEQESVPVSLDADDLDYLPELYGLKGSAPLGSGCWTREEYERLVVAHIPDRYPDRAYFLLPGPGERLTLLPWTEATGTGFAVWATTEVVQRYAVLRTA